LAYAYFSNRSNETALPIFLKVKQLYEKIRKPTDVDKRNMAICAEKMGAIYCTSHSGEATTAELSKAIAYYQECIALMEEIEPPSDVDLRGIACAAHSLSGIFQMLNNPAAAIEYFDRTLDSFAAIREMTPADRCNQEECKNDFKKFLAARGDVEVGFYNSTAEIWVDAEGEEFDRMAYADDVLHHYRAFCFGRWADLYRDRGREYNTAAANRYEKALLCLYDLQSMSDENIAWMRHCYKNLAKLQPRSAESTKPTLGGVGTLFPYLLAKKPFEEECCSVIGVNSRAEREQGRS
jgi:hypothetical protein